MPACPRVASFELDPDGKLKAATFWPDGDTTPPAPTSPQTWRLKVIDGWLGVFNGTEDQTLFVAEMREALNLAERVGGLEPVERCMSDLAGITAEALADPVARAILTGPGQRRTTSPEREAR